MIFYVIAVKDDKRLHDYLYPYLQKFNATCCFVSNTKPDIEESLFLKYNAGINQCIKDGLKHDDVIAFIHEDVKLLDPSFADKALLLFASKPDVGMLGVAGTSMLMDTGGWWHASPDKLRGHVIQENPEGGARHLVKGPVGFFDDLVAVDGLCFFIRGSLFLNEDQLSFDDKTYEGYHFYDLDTCLQVLEKGYKVACADILVQHRSMGNIQHDKVWHANRDKFINKYKKYKFPLTNKQFIKDNKNIIEINV